MRPVHWLVTVPITAVLVDFAVSNRQQTIVVLWPFIELSMPLWVVVLLALASGFAAGALVAWLGGRRWRQEARARARRIEALERELRAVEAQLADQRHAAAANAAVPVSPIAVGGRR